MSSTQTSRQILIYETRKNECENNRRIGVNFWAKLQLLIQKFKLCTSFLYCWVWHFLSPKKTKWLAIFHICFVRHLGFLICWSFCCLWGHLWFFFLQLNRNEFSFPRGVLARILSCENIIGWGPVQSAPLIYYFKMFVTVIKNK
jgi:hypothetical protein